MPESPAFPGPGDLASAGFTLLDPQLPAADLDRLGEVAFGFTGAGQRCLLDIPEVASTARQLKDSLRQAGILGNDARAIQAIAFDKTTSANWNVAWHQDVIFPFAAPVHHPGYELPTLKGGIPHGRPPRAVLESLLAARLHLDACGEANGPLRVVPGSHRLGVLNSDGIHRAVAGHTPMTCLARRGQVLVMRPLLLHASSRALAPSHRRVLHFVFFDGPPIPESWHRSVS